jgi:hypothetical protein
LYEKDRYFAIGQKQKEDFVAIFLQHNICAERYLRQARLTTQQISL